MLRMETQLATRFLYYYHFYHHADTSVTSWLRAAFIGDLETHPPDLIIEALRRPRVSGVNVAERFPALERFIAARYDLVEETEIYRGYLRKDTGNG